MKALTRDISFFFVAILAMSGIASAQVTVFAQVDSSKDIYVGESFTYNIIIDGENKPGQVDLTPLAKYNPQSAGNRDVSQTSISIVNGRTTKSIVKRYVMSYFLSAQEAGRIQLVPVTVSLGGTAYRTNPVEVNVLRPGTTDKLDLEVKLSEERCYVGQPVVMVVNFYYSADISDPEFNVPVFNSNLFYLEDPDVIDPRAKQFRLSAAIPEPVFVTQGRTVHKGKGSYLLSFSKILIPRRAGQIEIEAASVSADVPVGRVRSRDRFFGDFFRSRSEYKRFMVNSAPVELAVLPLPEDDKPVGFYGLVGRYSISASAMPTKVNVGDPITLTIKAGGSYLKPVEWPVLEEISELAENFKIPVQRASPTIEGGFKVFTQTIRANNDQVTAIPSIPLAFFDPDKGKYVVAETEPIRLEVAPTKILTDADLEGRDFGPVNKEVEAIKKGLSANYEGPDVLANMSFSPLGAVVSPWYAPLWGIPLAAFVLSLLVKFFTHTTPERAALKRRRQARGRAVRQLKRLASAEPQERCELLAATVKQYLGERFDRTAGSLTANDCYETIVSATRDGKIAERFRDIVAECEATHYASVEADIGAAQIKEVVSLVRSIEKKSKK
ncbi:MAG: BatD family protein [Planctomycetota bacterium]|nr:MAG: BatD family protein [Planctomycetota bacterium]